MERKYFTLLLIFVATCLSAQVSEHSYSLDNPTFLDATVADYDVFLTAEMHWRKENNPRKKKMIEYLVTQNSVEVVVVERSYSFGHWVNYYLETGDSLFLKEFLSVDDFFSTLNGVVYEDEYAFYCWLRQFNIENNLEIKVVGIDLVGFWQKEPILWSFLKLVDENPNLQEPLVQSLDKAKLLMEKKKVSVSAMLKWFRGLESNVEGLAIENTAFENYMFNLKQSIPWSRGGELNYRDGEIANNFRRYIQNGQKVYGQYGLTHIALKNGERIGWNTFGSVLNQDAHYKGRILSIGLVCFDCDADTPKNSGEVPGPHIYHHFLTDDDFDRLKPEFLKLPPNTFVDLSGTDELIKEYCQLLLIQFD